MAMQERNPVQPHTQPHPAQAMQPGHPVQNQPLNHPLMRKMNKKSNMPMVMVASVLVVLAGVATGWFLSGGTGASTGTADVSQEQKNEIKQSDTEAGMQDTSAFEKEAPIGKLVKGGIDGEGTYHLERDGGPTQNVYLSSTVIDLASFEGKKVQVWGNTLSGKKAGWLMDVGKIKVVE